jgi:phage-related protein
MNSPVPFEPIPDLKPVEWMGRSHADLVGFPDEARREVGFALFKAQQGKKSDSAKPLLGFGGASVLEIVTIDDGNAFRAVYTVRFAGAVYVLHCFQKKSSMGMKTQPHILQLIKNRLAEAKEHYEENYNRTE